MGNRKVGINCMADSGYRILGEGQLASEANGDDDLLILPNLAQMGLFKRKK